MPKRVLLLEHNVDGTVGGSHICLRSICRHVNRAEYEMVVAFYQDNPLISELAEMGTAVHVCAPFSPVVLGFSVDGILGKAVSITQSAINLFRMLVSRSLVWRRFLVKHSIDIVHLNNSCGTDPDLVVSAKSLGLPVIAHQRGFPPRFGVVERWMANRMDAIIAVSEAVRDDLMNRGVKSLRVITIYDGIELDRLEERRRDLSEIREEFAIPADAYVVGMLGNVKWWKGQEVLVKALPMILSQVPETVCLIVGKTADEDYKRSLDEFISDAGIQGQVIFTGYRSDATDLLRIMDVVVHASVEPEPFGLVVLEAMGMARAVIAADQGGPKETVLAGETGLLFRSGDATDLAEKILQLLKDAGLRNRLGENGVRRVWIEFSAEANARSIEGVYRELAGR